MFQLHLQLVQLQLLAFNYYYILNFYSRIVSKAIKLNVWRTIICEYAVWLFCLFDHHKVFNINAHIEKRVLFSEHMLI